MTVKEKRKLCPRCKRNCLELDDVLNSISHIGKKIMICSICGVEQGKVGMGISNDIVEIEMESRFKELGRKLSPFTKNKLSEDEFIKYLQKKYELGLVQAWSLYEKIKEYVKD